MKEDCRGYDGGGCEEDVVNRVDAGYGLASDLGGEDSGVNERGGRGAKMQTYTLVENVSRALLK